MQRGGRVFKFTEKDFKMETFIVNEDLSHEIQVEHEKECDQVDVCGGSSPPKCIVCYIMECLYLIGWTKSIVPNQHHFCVYIILEWIQRLYDS